MRRRPTAFTSQYTTGFILLFYAHHFFILPSVLLTEMLSFITSFITRVIVCEVSAGAGSGCCGPGSEGSSWWEDVHGTGRNVYTCTEGGGLLPGMMIKATFWTGIILDKPYFCSRMKDVVTLIMVVHMLVQRRTMSSD